jgi:hypothetical protein
MNTDGEYFLLYINYMQIRCNFFRGWLANLQADFSPQGD